MNDRYRAENLRRQRVGDGGAGSRRYYAAYRLLRQQRATRMRHEELRHSMCGGVAGLGVNAPLKPPRRLR